MKRNVKKKEKRPLGWDSWNFLALWISQLEIHIKEETFFSSAFPGPVKRRTTRHACSRTQLLTGACANSGELTVSFVDSGCLLVNLLGFASQIQMRQTHLQPNQANWEVSLDSLCTMNRMIKEQTRRVLGHLLVHLLFHSHSSLICLLHTACFAHLFTHSLQSSWGKGFCPWKERVDFKEFQPNVL